MKSFYYLGSPYRAFPEGKQAAFYAAVAQTAFLLQNNIPVFSPIIHCHSIDVLLNNPNDDLYIWNDRYMMNVAQGIIVCELPGWDKSEGLNYEIRYFADLNRHIIHMEPNVVPPFFNSYRNKIKAFVKNEY